MIRIIDPQKQVKEIRDWLVSVSDYMVNDFILNEFDKKFVKVKNGT